MVPSVLRAGAVTRPTKNTDFTLFCDARRWTMGKQIKKILGADILLFWRRSRLS